MRFRRCRVRPDVSVRYGAIHVLGGRGEGEGGADVGDAIVELKVDFGGLGVSLEILALFWVGGESCGGGRIASGVGGFVSEVGDLCASLKPSPTVSR